MSMTSKDRAVLRELGKQVADVAAQPRQQETIRLWKALNGLKPVRPMVAIDQMPWHELNVNDELTLRSESKHGQGIETGLRRTLYCWKHMRSDMVVKPVIGVSPALRGGGYGLRVEEDRAVGDPQNTVVGHRYHDLLQTEADLEKIKTSQIIHDVKATARRVADMREIFDGVLDVEVSGPVMMFNIWDAIVMFRGAENVLVDLAERPEFVHKLMRRMTDVSIAMVDQFESLGVLAPRVDWIHCTGAFTDELPKPGFNPAKPRAADVWACGMAQIFSSVSPDMHQEFDLDYLNPLYARFGLVYYGCCEPLDRKLDIVRKIPNCRKISMSPWVDVERGAAGIGRDFVFSRKPSPAFLATDSWDPKAVEKDLRETLAVCERYACPVELILKDISTIRYQPQRLWQWVDIAMRVVNG